jgi:hypothetical protein
VFVDSLVTPSEETVSRQLVHRSAVSEVYLTTSARVSDSSFRIEAQWPRRHYFFDVGSGRIDSVLLAETLRQATILTAHRYVGIPREHVFLMGKLEVQFSPDVVLPTSAPAEIEVLVDVDGIRRGSRGVTALRTRLSFASNGTLFAKGLGELQVLDPAIYRRMRPAATTSAPSSFVGDLKTRERGVTLRASGTPQPQWELVIDPSHPVFFDHPLDHIPGMLVIEAVRQLLVDFIGIPGMQMTAFDGKFSAFLDLDAPVFLGDVEMRAGLDAHEIEMMLAVTQRGSVAAIITVSGSL